MIREERTLRDRFEQEEKRERELFNGLSNALRFSHEKERAQSEKTKYWSIMASLFGALIGIFGTTVNSQVKLRQLRKLMLENTEASAAAVLQKLEQVTSRLPVEALEDTNNSTTSKLTSQIEELLQVLKAKSSTALLANSKNETQGQNSSFPFYPQDEKQRAQLLIATLSILVIVPLLIVKFSS